MPDPDPVPPAPEPGQEATGAIDNLDGHDPDALDALERAGIGEGDFDGDVHGVPTHLVELYEVLEWDNAVAHAEGRELPHPDIGLPPPNDPGVERSTPFHSRAAWGARPPRSRTSIRSPEGTTLHYGGPSPWTGVDRSSWARFVATADHARCPTIMRAYQRFHLDTRGWADFAYSSGDCPHGHRYEGRGPGIRTAAQGTTAGNDRSYAVCLLIGDGDPITDPAKFAALDEGRRLARLRWGHRHWKVTLCPGAPAFAWVTAGFPAPGGTPPRPPAPPPTSGGTVTVNVRVLRRGSKGGDVRSLQALLNAKSGKRLVVDGDFGPATDTAVRQLQAYFRLVADGVVGSRTWPTLFL
jgi:hypothetical protein